MTRVGRVEARQDNGLRPCPEENSALQVLCPSLSPRCRVRRSVSGRTLLLSRNSSSIWASRLLSLSSAVSSHRSFVCQRRRLQSTKSHSLSAMLRRYLYWTDIDIKILTIYKLLENCQICLQSKWRLHKRPKERQQKILCVLIFSAECPVPSLRFCDLQKTLRAETWHIY